MYKTGIYSYGFDSPGAKLQAGCVTQKPLLRIQFRPSMLRSEQEEADQFRDPQQPTAKMSLRFVSASLSTKSAGLFAGCTKAALIELKISRCEV